MREEVDRLNGKVEKVRKQVSVEGGRSGNGIEQVGLNNDRVRSEEGTGKQHKWIKVKGLRSKKVASLESTDYKNRFSVLD